MLHLSVLYRFDCGSGCITRSWPTGCVCFREIRSWWSATRTTSRRRAKLSTTSANFSESVSLSFSICTLFHTLYNVGEWQICRVTRVCYCILAFNWRYAEHAYKLRQSTAAVICNPLCSPPSARPHNALPLCQSGMSASNSRTKNSRKPT